VVLRYGYAEHAVSSTFGANIYSELRKYILTELQPDGRSSAIDANPHEILDEKSDTGNGELRHRTTEAVDLNTADNMEKPDNDSKIIENSSLDSPGLPTPIPTSEKEKRLKTLDDAYKQQILYIVGKEELQVPEKQYNIFKRLILGAFQFLRDSTNEKSTTWRIPRDKLVEVSGSPKNNPADE
jgi:KUP system potassium uptake protein